MVSQSNDHIDIIQPESPKCFFFCFFLPLSLIVVATFCFISAKIHLKILFDNTEVNIDMNTKNKLRWMDLGEKQNWIEL